MSISKELKEVLKQKGQTFENNPDFVKLQKFYEEMKDKGLIRKQSYSLAPLDTIGHTIYHRTSFI